VNVGGILSDSAIRHAVECGDIEIDPFDPVRLNPVSYDLTLGDEVVVYNRLYTGELARVLGGPTTLDARIEPSTAKHRFGESGITLHPGNGYLMCTVERVHTKKYVGCLDGKSSLGRLFMKVHETAGYIDPGFSGQVTLEVTVVYPLRVYPGMRIAQMRFHTIVGEVDKPYAGNYTGEAATGPVASKAWRQFK
jgi:dCTP deaminase